MPASDQIKLHARCFCLQCRAHRWGRLWFHVKGAYRALLQLVGCCLLVTGYAQPVTITATPGTLSFDRAITATVQASPTLAPWVTVASWDLAAASSLAVGGLTLDGEDCTQVFYRVVPAGTVAPPLAAPVVLTMKGGTRPSRFPEGVSAWLRVTLAWDPSPDTNVTGYAIYQGEASGVYTSRIAVGDALTVALLVPFAPVTYYWVATAYTAEGLESLPSNEVNLRIFPD